MRQQLQSPSSLKRETSRPCFVKNQSSNEQELAFLKLSCSKTPKPPSSVLRIQRTFAAVDLSPVPFRFGAGFAVLSVLVVFVVSFFAGDFLTAGRFGLDNGADVGTGLLVSFFFFCSTDVDITFPFLTEALLFAVKGAFRKTD